MPKIQFRPLTTKECRLLYEIWKLQLQGEEATRAILAARLGVSSQTVDRLIHNLRAISRRSYVLSRPKRPDSQMVKRSTKPISHYVLATKNLVHKSRTAALILELRKYPRGGSGMANRHEFIAHMALQLNLPKSVISYLIDRGIEKRYVVGEGNRIAEAERAFNEHEYLRLLASSRQDT